MTISMLNQLCALALLLLAASPATAPFQTVDLAAPSASVISPEPASNAAIEPRIAQAARARTPLYDTVIGETAVLPRPSVESTYRPVSRSGTGLACSTRVTILRV